ncbi:rad50 [Trypoxylus dichotomus]
MAKLGRLQICGIRSFGPHDDDVQDISFSSPVTLILGENGCGKTTIIESLKYACTGEYPEGSDKGAGFIQEPKLSASSTTKGFVKLRIIDSQGRPIIINRGAKVEFQSGGRLKLSKIDASVNTVRADGREVSLSGRCADIGEQISHIIGVSKPIINNVLFCHQERSLWPLEEDSQVKKKFDEIFDATKYNKCIADFRTYIKTEGAKLKCLSSVLESKREMKKITEKKRGNLQKDEDALAKIVHNIEKKENEIKPVSDEVQKICELENVLGTLTGELKAKEKEKDTLHNSRQQIFTKIKEEFKGSDYELDQAIQNFEKKGNEYTNEVKSTQLEISEIETQCSKLDSEVQKAQVRVGQLEAEKKQQHEKIEERNNQIDELSRKLKLTLNQPSEDTINNTISLMNNAIKDLSVNLNKEQEKNELEEKSQQEHIDVCRENIAKLKQERSTNITQKNEIEDQQRNTNSQIKQLDLSDELLKTLKNKIDELDRQIKYLVESYDSDKLEAKIKNTAEELETLEKKLETSENDYSILQKNYVTDENITTRTRDIVKRESKIFELKNLHYQNFKVLFNDPPEVAIKDAIEKRTKEASNELEEIKRNMDMEKEKITTNETSIRINEEKLNSYVKKVIEINEKIVELTQGNSFEQTCLDLEATIENLQKVCGQYRSAKVMYEKFVKDFQADKPCCPICETDFNDKKSLANEIVNKLKSKIEGIPQALEQKEIELKKKQEIFNQTQQLKPLYKEAKELERSSIPSLNSEITESKDTLQAAQENLRRLSDIINQPKKILEACSKIIGDAALIDKYNSEIDSYKKEINNLKSKLLPSNTDKSREQVDRDIKVCKVEILEKRKSYDSDTKKLTNNRKEYQELRDQKSEKEKDKFNLEKSMHNKPQLLELLSSLDEKDDLLSNEIKRIDKDLIPLKEELDSSERKLKELKNDNSLQYKRNMEEHNRIKTALDNIIKNQNAIEIIAKKNINEQLKTVLENYKSYKTKEGKLNVKKKELFKKIENIKEEQAKAEINKRNLEDNIDIRKREKDIKAAEESIQKLKSEIGTYNYATLQSKKQELQRQCVALIKEVSNIKGQKEILEKNITSLKEELELPEYKNAYNIYRSAYYQYETKVQALQDAKIYCKGLEEAIIQFHKEKMAKINETIRNLWQSVYKGNDIDYIQIRTEQPDSKTDSSRRTYNYRVIQIKHDVEIDMRGRCSAGQKVLACLLIRMALAMTFSHNCGILALDEPTTNLDKENVDSLCETLATMIQSRRGEKNFQLLIITHDEDFIRKLSQLENIDHYLRVTRNQQGNTVVTPISL